MHNLFKPLLFVLAARPSIALAFGRTLYPRNPKQVTKGTKLYSATTGPSVENSRGGSGAQPVRETSASPVDFDWKAVVDSVFATQDKRPIVLFDGVCNLCNGGVNFALDHDEQGKFRFVSLQSKVGQSLLLASGKAYNDISSIVLVELDSISASGKVKTKAYYKSDAVLRIAKEMDMPAAKVLGTLAPAVPPVIRNVVYDFVAQNRYRFGHADQCRLWDDNFDNRFIPDPEE